MFSAPASPKQVVEYVEFQKENAYALGYRILFFRQRGGEDMCWNLEFGQFLEDEHFRCGFYEKTNMYG